MPTHTDTEGARPQVRPGPSARVRGLPTRSLVAVSVLLPAIIFALAAWQNRRDVLGMAEARVRQTVLVLHEHAQKVFETQVLAIRQTEDRIQADGWSSPQAQASLHRLLVRLGRLEQVATITVTDADGRMRASSRMYPAPPIDFSDRDWFKALRGSDREIFFSRSYTGRQSKMPVFNVAGPVRDASGAFAGAIAVSVDRAYFERFYRDLAPDPSCVVMLFRRDGTLLARSPPSTGATALAHGALLNATRAANSGLRIAASGPDGRAAIEGWEKVDGYPAYVAFAIPVATALAPWRDNLKVYGAVAVLAAAGLLVLSLLVLRQTKLERLATARWRDTAGRLSAEILRRAEAEEALVQAQKMEAVGQLTGGIAHDFNNMLTAVMGNLELIRNEEERPAGSGRVLRWTEQALRGAGRAAALTQRLLAFSRRQALDPRPVDLNTLVAGMSEMLHRTLGEQVEIETVLAADLWPAFADPNQVESAVLNLAINARDAMPRGGKLTIETANACLGASEAASGPEAAQGEYARISVSDTGDGMTAEVLARVLEPFFTTKPTGAGSGLGLSQVYGFATQSGGHLKIDSAPGRGTTVLLYLPRSAAEAPASGKAAGTARVPPGSTAETVLVVEDDPDVRALTTELVRELGYRVLEAADGPAALDILERDEDVDLLFTDVGLPGMNGRQLADAARSRRPRLRVLFTTGYARGAVAPQERLAAGVDLIAKPFSRTDVAANLRRVLDRGR